MTAYPDWFNPNTAPWWDEEFNVFFNRDSGVDIDGLWIDMNEAANFCPYPCSDPEGYANENDLPPAPPPVRANPRPLSGFPPDFQSYSSKRFAKRASNGNGKGKKIGLPDRNLIDPPYKIANAAGSLSNKTIDTDLIHAGEGYAEYDTHNLYGTSKERFHPLEYTSLIESSSDELDLAWSYATTSSKCETTGDYSQHICRSRSTCRALVSFCYDLLLDLYPADRLQAW